ncbi:MAG: hypothetical protein U5K37_01245 [Natrialbaceae archaeon]|nr:hypothetical protein [Natrialbaceae archaeon]
MSGQDAAAPAQVATRTEEEEGGSRHTNRTNSVTGSDGGEPAERELPFPEDRVEEFAETYPELAKLPLTQRPGQRMRASLLIEEYEKSTIEPLREWEDSKTVFELQARYARSWLEAVEQLLESHESSRNMTLCFERGYPTDPEYESFETPAITSWMHEYQRRYFAELKGWVREAVGGERPSGGVCDGAFDDPYVVLMTRTASSIPDGERLPPVDHAEQIHRAWEPVYHTLRNRLEALGFGRSQWDYYRKEEPHKSDRGGGVNTCYTHEHTMLLVDGAVSPDDLAPVIEKHVEECPAAGVKAHAVEDAIEVKPANEVDDVAAYVASYTGIQPADLLERSVEYVAWAATQWAACYNRRTRSNAAGWAAMADACKQRFESDKSEQELRHGEEIVPSDRRGAEFECRACGSPWGLDQEHDTLTSARLSPDDAGTEAVADGGVDLDREADLRERTPDADAGARVGMKPSEKRIRADVLEYVEKKPRASVATVMGALQISPEKERFVREVLAGVDHAEPVGFRRMPSWRLDRVRVREEEYLVDMAGGVDMAAAVLPRKRLRDETRLRFHEDDPATEIVFERGDDRVATLDVDDVLRKLLEHGITEPWAAELHLTFERLNPDVELLGCFAEPLATPPDNLGN